MPETIRTPFGSETWKVIYDKKSELQKEKLRNVTIAQAIEVLIKDAYIRKPKAS